MLTIEEYYQINASAAFTSDMLKVIIPRYSEFYNSGSSRCYQEVIFDQLTDYKIF